MPVISRSLRRLSGYPLSELPAIREKVFRGHGGAGPASSRAPSRPPSLTGAGCEGRYSMPTTEPSSPRRTTPSSARTWRDPVPGRSRVGHRQRARPIVQRDPEREPSPGPRPSPTAPPAVVRSSAGPPATTPRGVTPTSTTHPRTPRRTSSRLPSRKPPHHTHLVSKDRGQRP